MDATRGVAPVPKRKRGALQDISNRATLHATAAKKPLAVGAKPSGTKPSGTKPLARGVKRSASHLSQTTATATANVRTVRGAHATAKRRRETAAEGKVQTKLLSFKSIAPRRAAPLPSVDEETKSEDKVKKEEQEEKEKDEPKADPDAAQVGDIGGAVDPEMECHETLKPEPSQPEPTPSAAITAAEAKIQPQPTPVEPSQPVATRPPAKRPVPPYQPRPYVFKFDHRDSGFDEETYRAQIRDIDEPFLNSAIHCVNIVRDMDRFHRQHEEKYHPTPDYIGNVQLDINEKMRTILIDWLVEVGEEYELDSQTFHKTVNLVDRCLAKFKINRKQFQLLGCACMMIAAKFEEVYGPNVDEFVYISDQTYTSEEMLEMEMKVLQALEYRIASTTCHGFLPRFTRAGCNTDVQKSLVQYLCDFAMLYYHMLEYRPSMLAAAAVYLSRLMTNEEQPWTPTLHHITRFNAWELKDCVMDLSRLHQAECEIVETQRDKAKAVSEKYVSDKFHGVSATPSVDEAVLEQSFLAYEQPLYMRRKLKQEAALPEKSGGEE